VHDDVEARLGERDRAREAVRPRPDDDGIRQVSTIYPEAVLRRLVPIAAGLALVSGCGGSENPVESADYIVELEQSLGGDLVEPIVYGQAGLTPDGSGRTRIVIRLDEPFESPMEAEIRRGSCAGSFYRRFARSEYDLGTVKDGELETVVEAPLRDLREGSMILVVRIPGKEPDSERAQREEDEELESGTCGELAAADPTDETFE
jgi:hypothetical protein